MMTYFHTSNGENGGLRHNTVSQQLNNTARILDDKHRSSL